MIPFFVADRPMSLRIIKGLPLEQFPSAHIGIMAHANTSLNFQEALQKYPCENFTFCDAVGGPCQFQSDTSVCPARQRILEQTIKMCDSGIFTREGATLSYDELFEAYERMGVEYGLMIDVFRDAEATIASAREAIPIYESYSEKFKLVVVAQGETVEEYIACYEALREMGFKHIAVGGLLQKVEGTARYAQVRDESFMYQVLEKIRARYSQDWLFALGCFHPNRHLEFKRLNVWGDYKGWIFQYKKRNEALNSSLDLFTSNHLAHMQDLTGMEDIVSEIQAEARRRKKIITKQKDLIEQLNNGKKDLKEKLALIYHDLLKTTYKFSEKFEKLTTHGLLKPNEENSVMDALGFLEKLGSEEAKALITNLSTNRTANQEVIELETTLNKNNKTIDKLIQQLLGKEKQLPENVVEKAKDISQTIQKSEQDFRLYQVRQMIATDILSKTTDPNP